MSEFTMTIDGKPAFVEASFAVDDPSTGEAFASAAECDSEHLDLAMAAAAVAYESWRHDLAARRGTLRRIAEVLETGVSELAELLVREQGKPLRDATREILTAAAWFKYYAEIEIPSDTLRDDDSAYVRVEHRPVGVVAAITPWNYPMAQAAWKLAPALLAGNTVVVKPSPYTPLTNLRFGELLRGVVPAGVLNVVTGGDELGRAMTAHPVPRKISFTGSTASGVHVAVAAARRLTRVTLELGGNDAAIVLDDVDPETAADGLFAGGFANCGQVCSAIKRVYVPRALHDRIVDALVDKARGAKLGNGFEEGVTIGPLNNRPQLDRVTGLVDDARNQGASVVTGGRATGVGYFYEPTIVTGAAEGVALVDEEQFGPVLPVMAYDTVDEAVTRANGTPFGLSGSVWGSDLEHATAVAELLECGTTWINTHRALSPQQPFGGHKSSGIGVENGLAGLLEFTNLQVVHRAR